MGLMNTKITLWKELALHPTNPSFEKKFLLGQYLEDKKKTINKNNEEVTSYRRFVLNEYIEIKENKYKLELGHVESDFPSNNAFEPISVKGSPRIQNVRGGEIAKEWEIYV